MKKGKIILVLILLIIIVGAKYNKIHNATLNLKLDNNRASFVHISTDEKIFTLYAFLNGVVDYNYEIGEHMTIERKQLINDIKFKLSKVDEKTKNSWILFYFQHGQHTWSYINYVLTLGEPPEFEKVVRDEDIKNVQEVIGLEGFNKIMSEFYNECDINNLYVKKYKKKMLEEANKYDVERIKKGIDSLHNYLRISRKKVGEKRVILISNPFESNNTSYLSTQKSKLYVIDGPNSGGFDSIIHEYSHMITNEVLADLYNKYSRNFEEIMIENRNKKYVRSNYFETKTYVDENLVRAINYRLINNNAPNNFNIEQKIEELIKRDEEYGFVLVPYFYEQLKEFEENNKLTFEDFMSEALSSF